MTRLNASRWVRCTYELEGPWVNMKGHRTRCARCGAQLTPRALAPELLAPAKSFHVVYTFTELPSEVRREIANRAGVAGAPLFDNGRSKEAPGPAARND